VLLIAVDAQIKRRSSEISSRASFMTDVPRFQALSSSGRAVRIIAQVGIKNGAIRCERKAGLSAVSRRHGDTAAGYRYLYHMMIVPTASSRAMIRKSSKAARRGDFGIYGPSLS
jgi:hypothetical protein